MNVKWNNPDHDIIDNNTNFAKLSSAKCFVFITVNLITRKLNSKHLCPIHVVTFTLISNLATDYIQKRRGEPGLFSFEYNLSPNLISK